MIGILFIPTLAHLLFSVRFDKKRISRIFSLVSMALGIGFLFFYGSWIALALVGFGLNRFFTFCRPFSVWGKRFQLPYGETLANRINIAITLFVVVYFLAKEWMPLGAGNSTLSNFLFVVIIVALILGTLMTVVRFYPKILRWCLDNKARFLALPMALVLLGITIWLGFDKVFGFLPEQAQDSRIWKGLERTFPGLGKEFMPALDEGSFLLMPTTMPHSGIEENLEIIASVDRQLSSIPEIDLAVGKWGRVNSALDPAPTSMYENVINYLPEYKLDADGRKLRFRVDREGAFELRDGSSYKYGEDSFRKINTDELIADSNGEYFRQWRPEIVNAEDIWQEVVRRSSFPGLTSAPKLQPIQTRLIMLSTGMRAPMGVKVYGPTLEALEQAGMTLEKILKEVPGIKPGTVFADRIVGKPYLQIALNRIQMSRYGMTVQDMQDQLTVAIGGKTLTTSVEGRERFPVRVRYAREYRDNPNDLEKILIPTPAGVQVPLGELADIEYMRGPQMIKSEDTFLTSYVIFDKKDGFAETDVVEEAEAFLRERLESGEYELSEGITYKFTGNYENQLRASKRLMLVVPISLVLVFLILYLQFKNVLPTLMVFSGVFVAFSGGFLMMWLYGQNWFLNFEVAGQGMRDLFQLNPVNLSVAVWVGFIALFGIATDDGVIMGTYLTQVFEKEKPDTTQKIKESVVRAGSKRVLPAMMTAATAIIALIPVLTATGKGADVVIPMAIPTIGGMLLQVMTMFVVPVLYCIWKEKELKHRLLNSKSEKS